MVVESETFPAEPFAVRQRPPALHKIAAGQTGRLHAVAQPCQINAAKNFQIGRVGKRQQTIASSLARMNAAIGGSEVHPPGEIAVTLGEVRVIPDEMIDAHV